MDAQRAINKGYTFAVATKAEKGQPWQTVYENLTSLKHALRLAQEIKAYDVAVLFEGKIYWKSSYPVINFTVIDS